MKWKESSRSEGYTYDTANSSVGWIEFEGPTSCKRNQYRKVYKSYLLYLSKRPISGGTSLILLELILRSVSDLSEQIEIGKLSNLLSRSDSCVKLVNTFKSVSQALPLWSKLADLSIKKFLVKCNVCMLVSKNRYFGISSKPQALRCTVWDGLVIIYKAHWHNCAVCTTDYRPNFV